MQHDDAGCDVHGPSAEVAGGVAEGAGLAHDAGNLLGALSLYSDLLALPGVLHEEYRAYAAELRLLSDRSWAMIHRLVNHVQVEHPFDSKPLRFSRTGTARWNDGTAFPFVMLGLGLFGAHDMAWGVALGRR